MLRKAGLLVLLGLAVVMAGCEVGGLAGSLRPLYTEKEVVLDPGLVGTWLWGDENEGFSWTFSEGETNDYLLTAEGRTEEGKVEGSTCEAHLVSLGMYTFLDTFPVPTEEDKAVIDKYNHVGLHDQYLLKREGDSLTLSDLNEEWLEERILEGDVHTRIAKLEESNYVMIGTTRELQQFFTYAAADPDAFTEFALLTRVKPPKAATPPK